MPITEKEEAGLQDLLLNTEENVFLAVQIARSVTQNMCDFANGQEALQILLKHIRDLNEILSKRIITKEVLLKYLHKKDVLFETNKNLTKLYLMKKMKNFWNDNELICQLPTTATTTTTENNKSLIENSSTNLLFNKDDQININSNNNNKIISINLTEQFAQQFTTWFFEKLNNDTLQAIDVWPDIKLILNIKTSEHNDYKNLQNAEEVIGLLVRSRIQNNIIFNPNLLPNGVQGRLDSFGMFLIVSCGTVHNTLNCVGIYEATFGLLRDPFVQNNWKIKKMQLNLRTTTNSAALPNIYEIEDFKAILQLPLNNDDDIQ